MKNISISNDIVPIAEFKSSISKCFKNLKNTGHPLVITQNGKPAGVLMSPNDYDELVYRKSLIDSVERGLSDANSGRIYSNEDIKRELISRRCRE
jgi:antitoxin YefM